MVMETYRCMDCQGAGQWADEWSRLSGQDGPCLTCSGTGVELRPAVIHVIENGPRWTSPADRRDW